MRFATSLASPHARACDTAEERLDPYNGLALAPHIDQLFDQGYITFDASGALVLSDECPQ